MRRSDSAHAQSDLGITFDRRQITATVIMHQLIILTEFNGNFMQTVFHLEIYFIQMTQHIIQKTSQNRGY